MKKYFKINKNLSVEKFTYLFEIEKQKNKKIKLAIKFDKKNKIVGVISLGDIRRLIFKRKNKDNIFDHLNKKPYILNLTINHKEIHSYESSLKKIINEKIENVLIIKNNKLINILSYDEIQNDLDYSTICVVGLGHIGLPLALHILKKKEFLIGYDKNDAHIKSISNNNVNFYEKGLNTLLNYNLNQKKIYLSSKLKKINSNIYIVCLGSEFENNKVNNQNINNILISIGKKIYKNNLILLRGTTQVGYTYKIAKKILEKYSNLKCGKDFFLGHIPERIVEGNALIELEKLPQIISGVTPECLSHVMNFTKRFFSKVVETDTTEESEIIKLTSNAYRDLNFAFANEISRIANSYNLSGFNLIRKANLGYPRNNIDKPSLGVGGYCLPKDVFLFKNSLDKNKGYNLSISREINQKTVKRISTKIINIFKKNLSIKDKILIMGATFKGLPENIDMRNSPSLELSNILKRNKINYKLFDVMSNQILKKNNSKNLKFVKENEIKKFKFLVIANNNPKYGDIFLNQFSDKKKNKFNRIIFDCWDMLDKSVCESAGFKYFNI